MLSLLLTVALQISVTVFAQSQSQRCATLKHSLHLENTTIIDATHVPAGSNVTTPGSCQSSAVVTSAVCRVQAVVNTTSTSAVHFEAWLPDQWFGRFLGLGNGGLGGCIDYLDLDYGSTLHFASVGSDNGHDGTDGTAFLNHPEVINDFAFRAIHVEAVLGKQIVQAYYGRPHGKAYYLGCSTGGRQAMQSALKFPEDFDGLVGGAPAVDFNHLLGADAMLGRFVGAPHPDRSPSFIPAELWPVISAEIMSQCDDLDGVRDGIITDPDQCNFRPEALLCTKTTADRSGCVMPPQVDALRDIYQPIFGTEPDQRNFRPEALLCAGTNQLSCVTPPQVDALRNIYQPIFGTQGQLLFTRYDPLAESGGNFVNMFSDDIFSISENWFKFAIFNDSNHSFDNFSIKDIEFADTINPGGIATWDGHFEPFRNRGGKLLTYHGRQDQLISSDNSLRFYNMISSTLSMPSLDDFYRLFLIPGMDHCGGGPGAWAFGQGGIDSNVVNASSHNVLLALVDWVERGTAPGTIVGSIPGSGTQRTHCSYPHKSVFNGTDFVCQ